MSILTKVVPLVTNGSGDASATVRMGGARLVAVDVEIGTLSTPDLTLTEQPADILLLDMPAMAAGGRFYPSATFVDSDGAAVEGILLSPVVTGRIEVVVAGGGASKQGELTLTFER